MASIKTVAVAGASGNVGVALVAALQTANYTVTALTRPNSTSSFPAGVKVVAVDYSSIESIAKALAGQDAVVSTVAPLALPSQFNLVEAAASAGVKRFFPSEYGSDTLNLRTRAFPILASKVQLQDLLVQKAKDTGMTYTLLFTGFFLDWALKTGLILDLINHSGKIYDGGSNAFSATTLASIAKGIVGCLEHAEETKNRGVYIQDAVVTQAELLAMAQKVDPGHVWDLTQVDTLDLERAAHAAFVRKDPDIMSMAGSVMRMYFGGEEFGMPFKKLDNELLGIKGMSDAEVEELVMDISTGKK